MTSKIKENLDMNKNAIASNQNHGLSRRNIFKGLYTDKLISAVKETILSQAIKADPNFIFDAWPEKQIVESFDFGISILEEPFVDKFHEEIRLPISLDDLDVEIEWKRPKQFIPNLMLIKEIIRRKFSYKSPSFIVKFMENSMKDEKGEKGNNPYMNTVLNDVKLNNFLSDNYNTFIKLLKKEYEIYVVNGERREETDEEFKQRIDMESIVQTKIEVKGYNVKVYKGGELVKEDKDGLITENGTGNVAIEANNNSNKKSDIKGVNKNESVKIKKGADKLKNANLNNNTNNNNNGNNFISNTDIPKKANILEFQPSRIHKNKLDFVAFTNWMGSILQCIVDLDLRDVKDHSKIFSKIYPQDNGIPVYNPSGRYWVKLYFMGKETKIEIDDRLPITENHELIFPITSNIEELWPSLLTKALLKLYYFKFDSDDYNYQKIGDSAIIYSLLGTISDHIDLKSVNQKLLNCCFSNILKDEYFFNKKKNVICYNYDIISKNADKSDIDIDDNNEYIGSRNDLQLNLINNSNSKNTKKEDFTETSRSANTSIRKVNNQGSRNKNYKVDSSDREVHSVKKNKKKIISVIDEIGRRRSTKNSTIVNRLNVFSPVKLKRMIINSSDYDSFGLDKNHNSNDFNNNNNSINKNNRNYNRTTSKELKKATIKNNNKVNDIERLKKKSINKDKQLNFDVTPKSQNKSETRKSTMKKMKNEDMSENNHMLLSTSTKNVKDKKAQLKLSLINNFNNISDSLSNNNNISNDVSKNNSNNRLNPHPQSNTKLITNKTQKFSLLRGKSQAIPENTDLQEQLYNTNERENEKTKIEKNFAYSIFDFFDNKDFNMERLFSLEFKDINNMSIPMNVPYKQLSKVDKRKYLEAVLKLKQKQKEIKQERIESLMNKGNKNYFIKVGSNCFNSSVRINEDNEFKFSDNQIEIAKWCLVNNKKFPELSYFEELVDNKSIKEQWEIELNKRNKSMDVSNISGYSNTNNTNTNNNNSNFMLINTNKKVSSKGYDVEEVLKKEFSSTHSNKNLVSLNINNNNSNGLKKQSKFGNKRNNDDNALSKTDSQKEINININTIDSNLVTPKKLSNNNTSKATTIKKKDRLSSLKKEKVSEKLIVMINNEEVKDDSNSQSILKLSNSNRSNSHINKKNPSIDNQFSKFQINSHQNNFSNMKEEDYSKYINKVKARVKQTYNILNCIPSKKATKQQYYGKERTSSNKNSIYYNRNRSTSKSIKSFKSIKYNNTPLSNNNSVNYENSNNNNINCNDNKELITPIKRTQGEWIKYSKFSDLFNKIIIINNTKFYKHHLHLDLVIDKEKDNMFSFNKDFSVYSLKRLIEVNTNCNDININPNTYINDITNDKEADSNTKTAATTYNSKFSNKYCSLLLQFESLINNNDIDESPNLNIKIIKKNNNINYNEDNVEVISNIYFNQLYETYSFDYLKENEDYFLIIESCYAPCGFHLSIFSDHIIEPMSYVNYLHKENNFYKEVIEQFIPEIPEGCRFIISKFDLLLKNLPVDEYNNNNSNNLNYNNNNTYSSSNNNIYHTNITPNNPNNNAFTFNNSLNSNNNLINNNTYTYNNNTNNNTGYKNNKVIKHSTNSLKLNRGETGDLSSENKDIVNNLSLFEETNSEKEDYNIKTDIKKRSNEIKVRFTSNSKSHFNSNSNTHAIFNFNNTKKNNNSIYRNLFTSKAKEEGFLINIRLPKNTNLENEYISIDICSNDYLNRNNNNVKYEVIDNNEDHYNNDSDNLEYNQFNETNESNEQNEMKNYKNFSFKILNYELFELQKHCTISISIKSPFLIKSQFTKIEIISDKEFEINHHEQKNKFTIQDVISLKNDNSIFKEIISITKTQNITLSLDLFKNIKKPSLESPDIRKPMEETQIDFTNSSKYISKQASKKHLDQSSVRLQQDLINSHYSLLCQEENPAYNFIHIASILNEIENYRSSNPSYDKKLTAPIATSTSNSKLENNSNMINLFSMNNKKKDSENKVSKFSPEIMYKNLAPNNNNDSKSKVKLLSFKSENLYFKLNPLSNNNANNSNNRNQSVFNNNTTNSNLFVKNNLTVNTMTDGITENRESVSISKSRNPFSRYFNREEIKLLKQISFKIVVKRINRIEEFIDYKLKKEKEKENEGNINIEEVYSGVFNLNYNINSLVLEMINKENINNNNTNTNVNVKEKVKDKHKINNNSNNNNSNNTSNTINELVNKQQFLIECFVCCYDLKMHKKIKRLVKDLFWSMEIFTENEDIVVYKNNTQKYMEETEIASWGNGNDIPTNNTNKKHASNTNIVIRSSKAQESRIRYLEKHENLNNHDEEENSEEINLFQNNNYNNHNNTHNAHNDDLNNGSFNKLHVSTHNNNFIDELKFCEKHSNIPHLKIKSQFDDYEILETHNSIYNTDITDSENLRSKDYNKRKLLLPINQQSQHSIHKQQNSNSVNTNNNYNAELNNTYTNNTNNLNNYSPIIHYKNDANKAKKNKRVLFSNIHTNTSLGSIYANKSNVINIYNIYNLTIKNNSINKSGLNDSISKNLMNSYNSISNANVNPYNMNASNFLNYSQRAEFGISSKINNASKNASNSFLLNSNINTNNNTSNNNNNNIGNSINTSNFKSKFIFSGINSSIINNNSNLNNIPIINNNYINITTNSTSHNNTNNNTNNNNNNSINFNNSIRNNTVNNSSLLNSNQRTITELILPKLNQNINSSVEQFDKSNQEQESQLKVKTQQSGLRIKSFYKDFFNKRKQKLSLNEKVFLTRTDVSNKESLKNNLLQEIEEKINMIEKVNPEISRLFSQYKTNNSNIEILLSINNVDNRSKRNSLINNNNNIHSRINSEVANNDNNANNVNNAINAATINYLSNIINRISLDEILSLSLLFKQSSQFIKSSFFFIKHLNEYYDFIVFIISFKLSINSRLVKIMIENLERKEKDKPSSLEINEVSRKSSLKLNSKINDGDPRKNRSEISKLKSELVSLLDIIRANNINIDKELYEKTEKTIIEINEY